MMPRTDSLLLKVALVTLSLIWVAGAVRIVLVFELSALAIIAAAGLVALAAGVWLLRPLARSVSKLLLGLLVVIDILGTFGPLYGLDHAAARYGSEISWASVLVVHVPLLVVAIALFWILDRFNAAFPPKAG